jgi:hypothetical protein
MSRNRDVSAPLASEQVAAKFHCVGFAYTSKQPFAEPMCIVSVDPKRISKNACFMSSAWMQGIQAIVFDFSKIENRPVAVRQARHLASILNEITGPRPRVATRC